MFVCPIQWALDDEITQDEPVPPDKFFPLQLAECCLRGISRVILVNNPLSGALILSALLLESPWQALLGIIGLLTSNFTAVMLGQDCEEVSSALYGFNGMLVALLMGVFSSSGEWYWWLLLPVCIGGATTTFLWSGLAPILDRWDLPVSVFPFNTVILLYLACTGTSNPYFPNYPALQPGAPESTNHTQLHVSQLLQGAVLGVGQIFACQTIGSSLLILVAVLLFSPVLAFHSLLGSVIGTVAAILSSYLDIALGNLLGFVGLPATSWAATLTGTLMLLLTGKNLKEYRIPRGQVTSPEKNFHSRIQWAEANTNVDDV
ncbi:Urea transporter 1 [Triplophysa tibetana]|uniref:Urea transporter n=1 Tax=Triplophysa tibetana TaxID=1572043 RepID=A0A5A9PNJ4_9TELE|nr:Urea transporter 1 [Triplophysa tibetana]